MNVTPNVDLEALLVALVLAPATFSRNRFFSLYVDAAARRVRRRASMVRSVVRQLIAGVESAEMVAAKDGGVVLTYDIPSLGLKRTAALDALELAVVRFAVARGSEWLGRGADAGLATTAVVGSAALPPALLPDPADTPRIERALAQLLPVGGWDEAAGSAQNELDSAAGPFAL